LLIEKFTIIFDGLPFCKTCSDWLMHCSNAGSKGNLNINIAESDGRIVSNQRMMSEGGSQIVLLQTEKLAAGIYTVIVNDDNLQNKQTLRFVKQ
jgi:hypothetical protein